MGTNKTDITPSHPVSLAGFAVRRELGPHTGVSQPIYARIFVIESAADGDKANRAVIVSADLIWWGSERVPSFKKAISERCGIEPDAILLHGTHTHSGPQTSDRFTSYLGEPDTNYLAELERKVLEGIAEALADLEPVRAERGTGTSGLAINRRGLRKSPPEVRVTDHELTVLRYTREDGTPKVALVHYACHPVITSENLISPDFVGIAMDEIERRHGGGFVCGFLQGTCGDQNPGDGSVVIRGDHQRVVEAGLAFADNVMRALSGPMQPETPCRLEWKTSTIRLPLASLPDRAKLESGLSLPDVQGEWHRLQLERLDRLEPHIPITMTVLTLTEQSALLAMDAEVVVEYGLFIKQLSNKRMLPVAYTNGMFGYVPTAAMLEEGGYEANESTVYFAMASGFASQVEELLKDELIRLIG